MKDGLNSGIFVNRNIFLLIGIVSLYLLVVTLSFGINHEPWGDERHFIERVRQFGTDNLFETLRDYGEVTPPLVFMLYALWGKLLGFEPSTLRLFSLVVAAVTHTMFGHILFKELKQTIPTILGLAVFLLNPYTIGLSLFVFTDMLMVFCILLL